MALGFKDIAKNDICAFINPREFAETHDIDGIEMVAMIDEYELLERDKSKVLTQNIQGLANARKILYVAMEQLGARPAIGRQMEIDRKLYRVKECTDEFGVLAIEIESVIV